MDFSDIKTVGFIGLGIMGQSMAGHILAGGYQLHVYNRSRAKAEQLIARGATWHDQPGEIAAVCDVVITMVGFPQDVEDIYLAPDGLVARARPGTVLIDMTTSSPSLAQRIAAAGAAKGVAVLDAPVSGGDVGARNAKLSIMIGGAEPAVEHVRKLLALMGENVVRQGAAGAGQHTKMANQITIASNMMAVCESLAYAKKAGLDPKVVLKSIGAGAAASFALNNLGPRMLDGDFAPGFYVRHFIKDMGIALAEAETLGLALPGLTQAKALYDRLAAAGHDDEGTQALFRLYAGA
ncbi:NAD(P)-dependent oxidoreductase [Acidocella sp.]|jgi:3-hydroxyisobutyrate dehydrogenase|uniref:NAD(P)-dependent oxidoreductase n=1 Tax=Acidocella sp. TaxID=50710 RepID=UPI002F3FE1F5